MCIVYTFKFIYHYTLYLIQEKERVKSLPRNWPRVEYSAYERFPQTVKTCDSAIICSKSALTATNRLGFGSIPIHFSQKQNKTFVEIKIDCFLLQNNSEKVCGCFMAISLGPSIWSRHIILASLDKYSIFHNT